MKYSRLLSVMLNGRWMIRPEDIYANNPIIERLLDRKYSDEEFNTILSDRKSLEVLFNESSKVKAEQGSYDQIPKDSTVIFNITGTMLKYGTWCSYGTAEIADAIRGAVMHPNVSAIILSMDSGGGAVDAIAPLVETIQLAQSKSKPVIAHVDLCASACLFVASFCNEIIAENTISSEIGSVGVVMGWRDYKEYYSKSGIKENVVYSSHSDWKNLPFRKAEEGGDEAFSMIQSEMLDPLALMFQETMKTNRPGLKLETEGIISGRMFYAKDALENGLIDSIGNMEFALKRAKYLREKYIINNYLK